MIESVAAPSCTKTGTEWTIVFDDNCPVVNKFGWLVRQWDRDGIFRYVGRGTTGGDIAELIAKLEETPWSLMLVDSEGHTWHGPDAIPFILKHLPSGKIAAVTYTIPGTMWITRQLYYMVSRNKMLAEHRLPRRTA
jgi:predicted DCC family thiol-disulfide oxidoreductase YuxK